MSSFFTDNQSKKWKTVMIILFGIITGLSIYLFKVSNVQSYLTDDPKACINCHVMTSQYVTWNHSSHREVAKCNDCHVPHENVVKKYAFKMKDGFYHASIFTLRMEPQTIYIREDSKEVIQNNCIRCHFRQVTDAKMISWVDSHLSSRIDRTCWECHRTLPHGSVNSLSAVGFYLKPTITNKDYLNVPKWISQTINQKENE